MKNFNLKNFLVENKLTTNSKELEEGKQPGADKLNAAIQSGKLDPKKIEDAAKKAQQGDSTELAMLMLNAMAGLQEGESLNEDNLEVKSIAKDIYSTLKRNGVNAKLIASIPRTGYAGKSIGATLTGGSNEALVFYWDDTRTKLTTIEIYLSGDKENVLSFEKENLIKLPWFRAIQQSGISYTTSF